MGCGSRQGAALSLCIFFQMIGKKGNKNPQRVASNTLIGGGGGEGCAEKVQGEKDQSLEEKVLHVTDPEMKDTALAWSIWIQA